ncbi:hypothetical protein SAMN05444166_4691 [Singulisphaera sp. GP187]|uniref:hypothetical protein n=1 Tax=Singulisphaera sp. GP187 TaxID=1882752 RepID=UPI00092829C6|nr:hypothetical protein [Singulisphaera sp. GP187]SIO43416.1 hypothetical protein SAMN05444166_4691 [Singulisphaera sp. GP187]
MLFVHGITTVSEELLSEVWLCAHLIVLHRRRQEGGRLDEDAIRRKSCGRVRDCLQAFSGDGWGQETVMACYQRATDNALSLDFASLQSVCGVIAAFPHH